MKKGFYIGLTAVLWAGGALALVPQSKDVTENDRTALSVILYQQNQALVEDNRSVSLTAGDNIFNFKGVSNLIIPESVLTEIKGGYVVEQNYNYDVLSLASLTKKSVGKEIGLLRTNPKTGALEETKATLISSQDGYAPVVQVGNRIEADPEGRLVFYSLPNDLNKEPTLSFKIKSTQNTTEKTPLNVTYLTNGLSFSTHYVGNLDPKGDSMYLAGFVSLTNTSDIAFKNAKVRLLSGNVETSTRPQPYRMQRAKVMAMAANAIADEAAMETGVGGQAVAGYTLYTLPDTYTLQPAEHKQVSLFDGKNIPVKKILRYQNLVSAYPTNTPSESKKVLPKMYISFTNENLQKDKLPLPAGMLRLYQQNDGMPVFLGENNLKGFAYGEKGEISFGEDSKIYADAKRTNYKTIGKSFYEASYQIELHNTDKVPAELEIKQAFPYNWQIKSESHKSEKTNSQTAEWKITVPAESEEKLSFTIEVRKNLD